MPLRTWNRSLRIGFISTRLEGTDGVSLETEKWAIILERAGHNVFILPVFVTGRLKSAGLFLKPFSSIPTMPSSIERSIPTDPSTGYNPADSLN